MTYFNTQIDNEKNTYSIQFETDDKQLFKIVEDACRKAVDVSGSDTEWVHLPCNIGKTVYSIRRNNKILETSVEKIIIKKNGIYLKLSCNAAMYETSCKSIGKTVFFDREAAEKVLEEKK